MCHCGKSEETTEHFFLACGLYQDIRPEDIDSLNLLDPEDCNTIVDYISHSTKLKGIVKLSSLNPNLTYPTLNALFVLFIYDEHPPANWGYYKKDIYIYIHMYISGYIV